MRISELGRSAKQKKTVNSQHFTLYARFSSTKKQELWLAFGRRAGLATVRNRAKRLAREVFRLNQHRLPVGSDIVITAKKGIGDLSRRDITGQIRDLFEYASKLSPSSFSEAVRPGGTGEHR